MTRPIGGSTQNLSDGAAQHPDMQLVHRQDPVCPSNTTAPLRTGGCACGTIRYECTEEPIVQLICHCRDCQRASGSAFAPAMFFASHKFRFLTSTPTYYEVVGGSGRKIQRGFCAKCGSFICAHWPANPLIMIVSPISLDDPSGFEPTTEIWLDRAAPWHPVHPTTMKFDGAPLSGVKDKIDAYFENSPNIKIKMCKQRLGAG